MVRCSLCGRDREQLLLFPTNCARCWLPLPKPLTPEERAQVEREAREEEAAFQASLAPLRALGRPVRVGLVGCGKTKRPKRSKAHHLYLGNLFQASLKYALAAYDRVYILSALHGLVELDQELEPYDVKMSDWRKDSRHHWGNRVAGELHCALRGLDLDIEVLAGVDYAGAIPNLHPYEAGGDFRWVIETPLEGMGVGDRLRYFKQASQQLGAGEKAQGQNDIGGALQMGGGKGVAA